MDKEAPAYTLVKDPSDLVRVAADLGREPAIAVDLEADSLFHYQARVCLIQISTPRRNILVDVLSLDDLSPLSPVFSDPGIRKVFHGADYDMRSLYRDFNMEVNSLFDTQIAARFLGSTQTGLAHLLKERMGVIVEKKYQKKDWSERPLSPAMLAYAVQDTCHLLSLSRILEDELRARNRLFCVEEECELLSRVRPAPRTVDPLFLRFKGARKLDRQGLAVLESILQLREETAQQRNRPPFKVLGNAAIMEIAERKPLCEKDLHGITGLTPRLIKMLGRLILERTCAAMAVPEDDLPVFPRSVRQREGAGVRKRIQALRSWRDRRAEEMGLDPSLVCTNAQIKAVALEDPGSPDDLEGIEILRKWQKKLFGAEICRRLKDAGR